MGQIIRNGIMYGGGSGDGLNVSKTILLESVVPSTGQALQYSQPIENFDYISITIHDSVGNTTCEYIPKENYGSVFSIQTWIANNGYISFCPNTGEVNATNNSTIDTIIGHKFSVSGGTSPSTPLINYSTEEQVIGTWVDGKPLYQKTIVTNSPSTSAKIFVTMDSNVDIQSIECKLNENESYRFSVPFYVSSQTFASIYIRNRYQLEWVSSSQYFNKECIVTVRYTKSTD